MTPNEILIAFRNSLQLSLNTEILDGSKISGTEDNTTINLLFSEENPKDPKLETFLKILGKSIRKTSPKTFSWQNTNLREVELITELLMLSRLDQNNLNKLAEIDPRFAPWVQGKFKTQSTPNIQINPTKIIFDQLEKKQMPQSDFAKKTEISLVSLYKFKNGGDIRLSNFLKMLEALNLEMIIKERK